ncbi:ribonuclease H1 domain-containing protein [Vallitalea okinawensis]|uniref:ribonuclease H1 domain-containing protein n=1 Tax=Vallitalea okinawensis TaxID=2078660 RepID=UPI000CFDA9A9|nr:ribonuclease H family protein [Vallitalea okinawensis]
MGKKVYAVRKGRKTGLFGTWSECEKHVKGYTGAEFKSFKTKDEAEAYLGHGNNTRKSFTDNDMIAYVDGSYDKDLRIYGSGAVILYQGEKVTLSESGNDPNLVDMRNVAGEILASKMAMDYALKQGVSTIVIHHDYEGIAKWCTKAWKANKVGTKEYAKYYDEISEQIEIVFVKVKAHSGNRYNDEADELAKNAIVNSSRHFSA